MNQSWHIALIATQYDTAAKKLTMSTAMRSYERANLSESFHMKSQALRGGTYTCSKFE